MYIDRQRQTEAETETDRDRQIDIYIKQPLKMPKRVLRIVFRVF